MTSTGITNLIRGDQKDRLSIAKMYHSILLWDYALLLLQYLSIRYSLGFNSEGPKTKKPKIS